MAEDKGNEQQKNSTNDFQDNSGNASFSAKENALNTGSQEIQAETTRQKENNENPCSRPNVVVNVPQNNDAGLLSEAKKANRYTRIGLVISTILALLTLGALGFTWWSVNTANKALADSRKKDFRDSINKVFDDSIRRNDRDTAYKRDTASLNLAKKTLNIQMGSVTETQKEFEAENRPYVVFRGVLFDSSFNKVTNSFVVRANLVLNDYGKTPAFVSVLNMRAIYKKAVTLGAIPGYINNGNLTLMLPPSKDVPFAVSPPITPDTIQMLKREEIYMYVFGEAIYSDVNNSHHYKTTCCFKCTGRGGHLSEAYYVHPYNAMTVIK